ncbi:MAG: hypothetical protein ACTSQY_00905 [Candidatus Odinarchaeia archaeon]
MENNRIKKFTEIIYPQYRKIILSALENCINEFGLKDEFTIFTVSVETNHLYNCDFICISYGEPVDDSDANIKWFMEFNKRPNTTSIPIPKPYIASPPTHDEITQHLYKYAANLKKII